MAAMSSNIGRCYFVIFKFVKTVSLQSRKSTQNHIYALNATVGYAYCTISQTVCSSYSGCTTFYISNTIETCAAILKVPGMEMDRCIRRQH